MAIAIRKSAKFEQRFQQLSNFSSITNTLPPSQTTGRVITPTTTFAPDRPWYMKITADRALLRKNHYRYAKRVLDFTLTLLAMPIILPIIAVCALLIKLESPRDPVFFTQMRPGEGGKLFKLYKLRTMVTNADKLAKELAHMNQLKGIEFKLEHDPRITRIGHFLRKTSLDEFPQFFNVLLGTMSLVGPRPTVSKADAYALWQTEILDVKPGITGLWQITGRARTDFDDRVRLDVTYIKNRCLWMDIQILARTVPSVLLQRGAC